MPARAPGVRAGWRRPPGRRRGRRAWPPRRRPSHTPRRRPSAPRAGGRGPLRAAAMRGAERRDRPLAVVVEQRERPAGRGRRGPPLRTSTPRSPSRASGAAADLVVSDGGDEDRAAGEARELHRGHGASAAGLLEQLAARVLSRLRAGRGQRARTAPTRRGRGRRPWAHWKPRTPVSHTCLRPAPAHSPGLPGGRPAPDVLCRHILAGHALRS